MKCPACDFDNPGSMKFCGQCGATLGSACPGCGFENPPGFKFCGECAALLGGESAEGGSAGASPSPKHGSAGASPSPKHGSAGASPSQRTAPEPRSYTPKHLAEKILASKSALEGERKQVTVLFADVKGSMDLAEQVDAEDWHRILNKFFEILTDGVHRFEGTVNQYTGDGIMALFGAPITHEDHAQRACYTVLHLQDELRRYSEELKRTRALTFSVRMGLHSGEVIVGKIGDDLRMDYTAQGHTVGLAARLEHLADPGKAYVSEATAKLVSGYFRLRDLGEFELKGVGRPQHVFELEGAGEFRTRLDASKARGLSRFVGRVDDMATLEQALTRALEGNAQVVGIMAEAGTGKSRLCFEFLEKCRGRALRVREVQCVAHGKSIPLLPVFELLRGFFGVTDRDTDIEARRKIAGTLLLLDKDLIDSLPILFEFLGIPDPASPLAPMNPEAKRRQIFALSRRVLQARNQQEPGIILIEDLHWMDSGSEQFLENLVEAMPGTRTLLLLNYRPEYQPGWAQKSYYRQVPILPLRPDEIADLLHHLLGKDASLRDLSARVQAQAAGNPFFIEEAVQSLVESGKLQGVPGAYTLQGPVEEILIPSSVQSLLGARIDRLPEREKQVLQTAAVIGKEFPEPVLRQVASLADVELGESLRALARAEFIYESALYPELEYAFKHPLTQEVAYRSQLADRRARVHAAVARTLAEIYPTRLDEHSALLAHHWENAGDAGEAAQWHQRAAEWAGLRDPGEALRHWGRVRDLLAEVPESPETIGLGVMARMRILNFGWRLGMDLAEAERIFEEGKALAGKARNTQALALLHFLFSAVMNLAGELPRAAELVETALGLAEEAGDPGLVLMGRVNLSFTMSIRGRLAEALAILDDIIHHPPENRRMGGEVTGFTPFAQAHFLRTIIYGTTGRLRESEAALDEAVDVARENGDTEILGWLQSVYVYAREYEGNSDDVMDHARRAVEIAEKTGSSFSRVLGQFALGQALLMTGDPGAAREALERSLELCRSSKAGLIQEGRILGFLAEAHLALGDPEAALAAAREGLALLRGCTAKFYEIRLSLTLARVLLRTEGVKASDEIRDLVDQGLRDCLDCGTRGWAPFFHEVRAELLGLLGDGAGRLRELSESQRIFAENGAEGHAARIATELER